MIACPPDHPLLPGLFDPHVPNNPALWAVFSGHHAGQAVVDDLQKPAQCLVHTAALLTYASLGISQEFQVKAIQHYRQTERIWLVRNQGDPPAPTGYRLVPRIEFYDYDAQSKTLAEFRNRIPPGAHLQTIDMELLQRCEWRDDMRFYCGSLENFLQHGLGICLMQRENILCEAYASALGAPYAEIGAITHEPYRGKGLAPVTVSYLIDMLEKQGFHAYWSCDQDNPASAQVARKLGFKVERPYELFDYEPVE